jgi:lysophospholipase
VIATGRSEFCEKYSDCAEVLQSMHYNTVVFDWRGQGLSSRALRERQKGHVDSFDEYIADLEKIIAYAAELFGGGAIYVLAHSMGAHIALRAMASRPGMIRAAILIAPMIDIARDRRQFLLFRFLSSMAVLCGLGHRYVLGKGDHGQRDGDFTRNILTHDPGRFAHEQNAIADNPDLALGGPSWGWLHAALISIERLQAEAGRITADILIVSAGDDRVVNNQAQADFARHLPSAELVCIPGSYHEILQETPPIQAAFWIHAKDFLARTASGDC